MGQMTTIPRNYKEMQKICDSCTAEHGEKWAQTHCHKCNVSFVRDSLDREVAENLVEIIMNNIEKSETKKAKKKPEKTVKTAKARAAAMDSMVRNKRRFDDEEDDCTPLLEKDESEDYVFSGFGYNNDDDYYDD